MHRPNDVNVEHSLAVACGMGHASPVEKRSTAPMLVADLVAVLAEHPEHALFVTELVARLGEPRPCTEDVESALAALDGDRVVVVDHPSPDPHLVGDLRVVALAGPSATDAGVYAERAWTRWVREALVAHRCC